MKRSTQRSEDLEGSRGRMEQGKGGGGGRRGREEEEKVKDEGRGEEQGGRPEGVERKIRVTQTKEGTRRRIGEEGEEE